MTVNSTYMQANDLEKLYLDTADSEHIEMYLKAIWRISEKGEKVKISSIAKILNVKQPSVVQMLHKLNVLKLVKYESANPLIEMTSRGEKIGKHMMRNTRLLEVLMKNSLKIEIDEEMVCGVEHHMKPVFTNALCTLLKHPKLCPHGNMVPRGECCYVTSTRTC
jgi:DtxR family transcriptional regulator, Mn-dependent transcriptional regulator